jgi:signal peptidase I
MTTQKRRNWAAFVGVAVALLGVAFILLRVFAFEPFRIPSASMAPTLQIGDYILAYKWPYGRYGSYGADVEIEWLKSGKPKRGEVFVFKYPRNRNINYVKRVIGLPGDRIRFDGHALIVNGIAADRKRLSAFSYGANGAQRVAGHIYQETVQGVSYRIFLEDDTPDDLASGAVVVPPNQYFMMGDNRDNASDSRYWGFVPAANIVGKAVEVFMSPDTSRIGPITP